MSAANGYNPLRWKCNERGCFNEKQRPKIEVFCEAFPGRVNFSDVDGIVEIAGNALMLEWKCAPMNITTGQRIMFERLTKGQMISVVCVAGDAETMAVSHIGRFFDGKWHGWNVASREEVDVTLARWADWAKKHPRFRGAA